MPIIAHGGAHAKAAARRGLISQNCEPTEVDEFKEVARVKTVCVFIVLQTRLLYAINKASLHSKQGFFTTQRSLVYNTKKASLKMQYNDKLCQSLATPVSFC